MSETELASKFANVTADAIMTTVSVIFWSILGIILVLFLILLIRRSNRYDKEYADKMRKEKEAEQERQRQYQIDINKMKEDLIRQATINIDENRESAVKFAQRKANIEKRLLERFKAIFDGLEKKPYCITISLPEKLLYRYWKDLAIVGIDLDAEDYMLRFKAMDLKANKNDENDDNDIRFFPVSDDLGLAEEFADFLDKYQDLLIVTTEDEY